MGRLNQERLAELAKHTAMVFGNLQDGGWVYAELYSDKPCFMSTLGFVGKVQEIGRGFVRARGYDLIAPCYEVVIADDEISEPEISLTGEGTSYKEGGARDKGFLFISPAELSAGLRELGRSVPRDFEAKLLTALSEL